MGTGVVAFNIASNNAILGDTNPHLINFYSAIEKGKITPEIVNDYLNKEGKVLLEKGEDHYYFIRDRFNGNHAPLDFLFINRAGFNGMIRFNHKGNCNIPFCQKPNRFAKSYITKITNQVGHIAQIMKIRKFSFKCQKFEDTIAQATEKDIIYCDPPYIDRHADYYNGWDDIYEKNLFDSLANFSGKFILSTWHHNDYRNNDYIASMWSKYSVLTKEHFYHVGGKEINRNPMIEALIVNFPITQITQEKTDSQYPMQYALLDN